MCVSNITLVGGKKLEGRNMVILFWSMICVVMLGVFLGVVQTANETKPGFHFFGLAIVGVSFFLSGCANNYAFENID